MVESTDRQRPVEIVGGILSCYGISATDGPFGPSDGSQGSKRDTLAAAMGDRYPIAPEKTLSIVERENPRPAPGV
jgi:hypothetical protein